MKTELVIIAETWMLTRSDTMDATSLCVWPQSAITQCQLTLIAFVMSVQEFGFKK
jgi:hypothetical protein